MQLKRSQYQGEFKIGDIVIPCAVLEDGNRVIAETGISKNLGALGGKSYKLRDKLQRDRGCGPLPLFLASKCLEPFIDKVFKGKDLDKIEYIDKQGNINEGYHAGILPKVCEVWLQARDNGVLQLSQQAKVRKAETLMRGLAHTGICALIDEATGYQNHREKNALQIILDKFLNDEAKEWTKTFPDEFWFKLLKVKGFPSYMALNRPAFVGHWVNDVVYSRLAPGIKKRLNKINPKNPNGNRTRRHHQHLSDDYGVKKLKDHINKTMVLMDISEDDKEFKKHLDKALPKY